MKPALLVIDCQKAFFQDNPEATASLRKAAEYINAAIELFRKKGFPVVCVQHMNPEEKLIPGEEGFDFSDALQILQQDLHIQKTYSNSFNKTPLYEKLRAQSIDTVILTGFAAEGCVSATYRGAKDLDLTPILLRGSLVSSRPEFIPFVEGTSELISYFALCKALE